MSDPRWTVDESGQNPRFGKLTFSLSGNGTNQERMAAWDALVVAVRDAQALYDECDKVGIPHSAEVLVRHHRGNAGMAGAADAMASWAKDANTLRQARRLTQIIRTMSSANDDWWAAIEDLLDLLSSPAPDTGDSDE